MLQGGERTSAWQGVQEVGHSIAMHILFTFLVCVGNTGAETSYCAYKSTPQHCSIICSAGSKGQGNPSNTSDPPWVLSSPCVCAARYRCNLAPR
jgi:hypothetical protein